MIKIGETLKNKRMEKKLTLEEVYYATRIPPQVITALEEEKFDKVAGGAIYVKSFLKKYAEFLGLNSNEIVNAYLNLSETPPPNVIPSSNRKISLPIKFSKKLILGSISLIIIFIFLNILIHSIRKSPPTKKLTKPVIKAKLSQEPLLVPLNEELVLKIKAKKDTWIQLKSNGKIVFQHVLKAGAEETWRTKKEFELWVGEVKNLVLSLNEKLLQLKGQGAQKGIIINHKGLHYKE